MPPNSRTTTTVATRRSTDNTKYKSNDIEVSATDIDTAAAIVSGDEFELDPQAAKAVRRKIDWHILPLMCSHALAPVSNFSFAGRAGFNIWVGIRVLDEALQNFRTRQGNFGQCSHPRPQLLIVTLGHREETHLTTNQYNWLGTLFYLSYLVFEFPQNLALQRFPVAKWLR
ncbi:hypothetical protein B0H14DRAFT_2611820 [Mycena olivaceomarginata]|nr:hypothetical protein B0H14DRAFT_2611820 [Mycena olivaceomarginata]